MSPDIFRSGDTLILTSWHLSCICIFYCSESARFKRNKKMLPSNYILCELTFHGKAFDLNFLRPWDASFPIYQFILLYNELVRFKTKLMLRIKQHQLDSVNWHSKNRVSEVKFWCNPNFLKRWDVISSPYNYISCCNEPARLIDRTKECQDIVTTTTTKADLETLWLL